MSKIECNLRVLMAERKLNIQNLKDLTTLSRTTISNLFNNNAVGVRYETLVQLCDALNCTPGDLFSYKKNKQENEERTSKVFYRCLDCGHEESLSGKRKDYKEVILCPVCEGTFVDSWYSEKYRTKS